MRIATTALLLAGLAACTSLPSQQNLVTQENWQGLGERDGQQGRPAKTPEELNLLAKQYQVQQASYEQYLHGHHHGIGFYCAEQDPYELGRTGRPYFGVCDDKDQGRFKLHWQRGRDKFLSPELPE